MSRGARWAQRGLACASVLVVALSVATAVVAGGPPPILWETAKLVPSGKALEIELGWSLAIQDDTVFGGAPMGHYLDDESEGSTFVFERDPGGDWSEVARLRSLDGEQDHFGYALGVSGETLVVASRWPPMAAWIFERDGDGDWVEAAYFENGDVGGFGWSAAISGTTVVVGAPYDDFSTGLVFVYERIAGEWKEVQRLSASDAEDDTEFGWALAIEADTLLVGAPDDDCDPDGPRSCGALYVFEREGPGSPFAERAKLRASDPSLGADLGRAAALSGDLAVVGAPYAEILGEFAGAAYLFERDADGGGGWTEVAKLTDTEVFSVDEFGFSVAVEDGLVVVGEPSDRAVGSDSGMAHLFERDPAAPGGARYVAQLRATDGGTSDHLGWSVGISGDTVVAGARWEDEVERNAGAIYVYDAAPCRLELRAEPPQVQPGDTLTVDVALRHNRFRSVTAPFLLWIEDAAGSFVAGARTRPLVFRHGDTVHRRLALRVPEGTPPGAYSVLVGIERMEQGLAGARAEVRVVE